jgi:hypothetical protein
MHTAPMIRARSDESGKIRDTTKYAMTPNKIPLPNPNNKIVWTGRVLIFNIDVPRIVGLPQCQHYTCSGCEPLRNSAKIAPQPGLEPALHFLRR